MRTTSPEASNLASCFRIRALHVIFNEAGDFELLSGEDIKRKKMSEAVVLLGSERMKDGIVRDAEVSSHQIDEDLRVRHAVIVSDGVWFEWGFGGALEVVESSCRGVQATEHVAWRRRVYLS